MVKMTIEKRLERIEQRNQKVELDKEWETSIARKVVIAILTYAVIVLFFYMAELPQPFINAIVPTVWFVLSTLSLTYFKQWWIKWQSK